MIVIDRIEGGIAVVEDTETEKHFDIPLSRILGECREGDVLAEDCGVYRADFAATEKRRAEVLAMMRKAGLK